MLKRNLRFSIFFLLIISTTRAHAQTSPSAHKDAASITGQVVDQAGDSITGATVALLESTEKTTKTTTTAWDGFFRLAPEAGLWEIQISAPGFTTRSLHGEIVGAAHFDAGQLTLTLEAGVTEVLVSATRQELAEEQIKVETGQRILGIIPNFLVSYDRHPVPLNAKQKYKLALKTIADPETIGVDLALAGLQQKTGASSGYGAGPGGYAKSFAASYGTGSIDTILGSAVFPSIFKQDPRYFYKGTGSVKQRAFYAIGMSVACKGDNGHWQYNYSGLFGGLAAGGISNLYVPSANRSGFGLTFENTAIGIGSSAISNLFQEFLVRRFTRNAKHWP